MKTHITIYIVAAAALSAVWFVFVFSGMNEQRSEIDALVAETEAQLHDYESTIQSLPEFLARSKNLEAFKRQLNSSLYDKSEILKLLQQITQDAVDNGLTVVEITPPVIELLELNRVADVSDEPLFLNLTLDIHGDYVGFGKYVAELERKPYFRTISACNLRGARGIPYLECSITFKALIGTPLEGSA
ncbi:type 4a pilus biogenesis protein PilO [candidate division GN15 bacterium]|nr:type 4a pilus biogenesis protein PilO [candidate division GN15 bacterium]